jgi:hypothetical protein
MHQQNACLYLAETTWLFTQLWASLQSGEADGGVVRQSLTRIKVPRSYKISSTWRKLSG